MSLLDYLEGQWPEVPVGALAVQVLLWSCGRKLEVAGLTWDLLRPVGPPGAPTEFRFDFVVEHGVRRWFRVPEPVYRGLLARRQAGNPGYLRKVGGEFAPSNSGTGCATE